MGFTQPKEEPQAPKADNPVLTPEQEFQNVLTQPKAVLYAWEALSRPQKSPVNKKTAKTFMMIGIVVALVLVAMQEFILILGVISIVFLTYVLTNTPPENMKYELSNHGLDYGGQFFYWNELSRFFFVVNEGLEAVAVDTVNKSPARLFLTVLPDNKEQVKSILAKHLLYLEHEPKTAIDKAFDTVLGGINTNKS